MRERWAEFRGERWWVQMLAWLGAGLGLVLVLGAVANATSGSAQIPSGYTAGVAGEMHTSDLVTGDSGLRHQVSETDVWCGWRDGQVYLHVAWKNASAAVVTVSLMPEYEVKDGGTHGDSATSEQQVTLEPGEKRSWTAPVGMPDGVTVGSQLSACEPSIDDVSAGGG